MMKSKTSKVAFTSLLITMVLMGALALYFTMLGVASSNTAVSCGTAQGGQFTITISTRNVIGTVQCYKS